MKRFLFVPFLVLTTAAATAQPVQPPAVAPESISVSGTGRSSVAPDRFSFTVGVQTVAPTVDDAVQENNRRVASVISALQAAGAQKKDIQTSQFQIWPQQDFQEGRTPRITGYQVTNTVHVRSERVQDAGRLLGIAIGAGVNNASGIQFEVSDPARGRDTGLRAAFEDARAKAALLAQAAGRTLGRALYISEGVQNTQHPPMPMARTMAMEAKVADVPVEPGMQESSYTVSVTFELR